MKKVDFKKNLPKYRFTFLVSFLLLFMIWIFGPAEIFFANCAEFEFVYGEFAFVLAVAAIGAALVGSLILVLFPEGLYRLVLSVLFGISVAGYIQVMFLNGKLDLLGENPEGYLVDAKASLPNLLVWIAVLAVVIVLAYVKPKIWKSVLGYASGFLLAIQCVAYLSLVFSAPEEAYRRSENNWHLSGEEQFTVSAEENVIVIVLDWMSNQYIEPTLAAYPDALDGLKDFTYYNNADCLYFGTYPSMPHFLTGEKLDPSVSINEWFLKIWETENAKRFYSLMREQNYVCNLFTPDALCVCGTNSPKILADSFSNLSTSDQNIDVFYKLLYVTVTKMSCYRMMPEIAKPYFYTDASEYTDIITYKEEILHQNADFYRGLKERGLKTVEGKNYFIVQHFRGSHEFNTTAECEYRDEKTSMAETVKGCMVLVDEYLNQLKELGVYDDATIIVTSDHGSMTEPQIIFFIKEAGETKEEMAVSNAPISLAEFIPTIVENIGEDATPFGETIYDFEEDELREREVWIRASDGSKPFVPHYYLDRDGHANVYDAYIYTGDYEDLRKTMDDGLDTQYDMVESFF